MSSAPTLDRRNVENRTDDGQKRRRKSGFSLLFRLDFNDELREARLLTGSRILVPELTSGGAVKRAANATELGFGSLDIAGAKLLDKGLDTVADDRARGAITVATDDILSKSFFSALNIRHVNLCSSKNLRFFQSNKDEDFRNRQRMGKTCRRVRRTPANAASTLSSRVDFPYRKGKRRDLPALSARTTPRRRFGTPTNADILT